MAILLGNDNVVKVPGHLHPALFAVGPVPYAKRPFHARVRRRPRVERVFRPRVALLRGRGRGRFDVHGVPVLLMMVRVVVVGVGCC